MRKIARFAMILSFAACIFGASAQQINYTPAQSAAIHESITRSRWDAGGSLSKYSFRYMSELFPVGIINKSGKPYSFLYKPKKALDNIITGAGSDTLSLESYLKKLHIAGFIVVYKGAIVYEKYFSMLPSDQHTLQSVTKVITSTLITSLINDKKIDINKSIEQYHPELKGSDWEGISVKNILDMRSGIDIRSVDFETGPFTNSKHKNYQLESALGILPKAANTPTSVFKFLAELKKRYSSGTAGLLFKS